MSTEQTIADVNGETPAARLRRRGLVAGGAHTYLRRSPFREGLVLARRGALLPPYDTRTTLQRMAALIDALRAGARDRAGRFLSRSRRPPTGSTSEERAMLAAQVGAHRLDLDRRQSRSASAGLARRHGDAGTRHRRPRLPPRAVTRSPQPGEIAGHLHPCATVTRHGRSLRRRCFAADGMRAW